MKSTQRILALVLCLVLCLALFPASASAAGIIASGSAGPNAEFVLYTDGKLVISGQGQVDPVNQWSFSSWGGYASANDARVQTRSEIKTLVIEEGIRRISPSAFQECAKLVSVELPVSLSDQGANDAIGQSAFQDCSSLVSIYIPNNVQSIGVSAFQGCTSLSEIYLSDGLQNIWSNAFFNCTALRSITIPANVQTIGAQAFANCNSLKEITFTGNFPAINNTAFQNVRADVYYPVDNDSWNNGPNPMVNNPQYGGRLTWHASAMETSSDGWVQKNGSWYYYQNGVMVRDNWVAYQGFWFHFGENGRMQTGRQLIDGNYYYLDPATGVRQSGLQADGNFYDENGVWQPAYSGVNDSGLNMFSNGWQQSADGKWFYIKNKAKVTGWIKDRNGNWYYLDPTSGAMVTGWLTWNGNTYYLRPLDMANADGVPEGAMIAGRTERIGDAATGQYYTFDASGALQGGREDQSPLGNLVNTGWQQDLDANGNAGGGWYFYRSDGTRVQGGWEMISNGINNNLGNKWYYFNDNGTMKTGWLKWNGEWYWLTTANGTGDPRTSTTGQMVTGFVNIGTTPEGVALSTPKTYFFKSNGALNGKGWIQVGKKWFYLRNDGSVATGWLKDGKNWFYLDDGTSVKPSGVAYSFGEMVTGAFTVPAMCNGEPNDQPGLHSFKSNGVWIGAGDQLHKSTAGSWAKNNGWHYYDADGVALTGWQYIDGKWYYLDPTSTPAGKMRTGFFQDNTGTWYYADSNGVMQKGWQQIDGTWYLFDGNGARVTGWYQAGNGNWYYLNPAAGGGMVNNVSMEIDGEYWAFNGDGVCTGKVAG